MHKEFYLKGGTAFLDGESAVRDPLIKISSGRIESVQEHGEAPSGTPIYRAGENDVILPGFIDIHIHGANGADTMDGDPDALRTIADFLPQEGVTSFLATTITSNPDITERALQTAGAYHSDTGAELLGIHLEGPFISRKQAGAQPVEHITPPDVELFKRWQKLAENRIRLVTLAPEEPNGLDLLKHFRETGVIGSVGHSHASYEEMQEALENGLSHATHLFNGMRPLHHREPGVVGSIYLSSSIKAELILDGIHVRPEVARLSHQVLGSDRLILITDAIRGKGLGNGTFDLGGQEVSIHEGEARLSDGTLAGSVLKMDEAVRRLLTFPAVTWPDVVKMTSQNAAASLGLHDRKGKLAEGYDADIVIMSEDGHVIKTFCRGEEHEN